MASHTDTNSLVSLNAPGGYVKPVEKPNAPSCIACRASSRIRVSSGSVGRRSSHPIASTRMAAWGP